MMNSLPGPFFYTNKLISVGVEFKGIILCEYMQLSHTLILSNIYHVCMVCICWTFEIPNKNCRIPTENLFTQYLCTYFDFMKLFDTKRDKL